MFQLFSRKKKSEIIDVTETFKTLILAKIDRLEEKHRRIETEWSDVYDKIMLLYDRTRKRIQQQKKAAEVVSQSTNEIEAIETLADPEEVLAAWRRQQGGF